MPQTNLKYIRFEDFTPGIVSYTGAPLQTIRDAQPGVAAETGTARCIALPGGGLGPLPGHTNNTFINPGTSLGAFVCVGGGVVPHTFSASSPWTNLTGDQLHFAQVWFDSSANVTKMTWFRIDVDTNTATVILTINTGITTSFKPTPFFFDLVLVNAYSSGGSVLVPNITVVASWHDENLAHTNTWFFPNPYPGITLSDTPLSLTRAGPLFSHQGRVLQFPSHVARHGTNRYTMTNEGVDFTAPPLSTNFGNQQMILGPNDPGGYGSWASLGDQGFVLLKRSGGAVVVTGDLTDPPGNGYQGNVQPTGSVMMPGILTPLGVVYASDESVYLWDGKTSTNISRQLKPRFHIRADPAVGSPAPRVMDSIYIQGTYWNDCVFVPNNWLYSTITKSWWRNGDNSDGGGFGGVFLSGKNLYTVNDFGASYNVYDTSTPNTTFTWTSQPITPGNGRRVDVREIEIVAQASAAGSTVRITLTDQAGATQFVTFALSATNQPMRLRQPISVQAYSVIVNILSTGTGGSSAPIVYSVFVGYHDAQSTAGAV